MSRASLSLGPLYSQIHCADAAVLQKLKASLSVHKGAYRPSKSSSAPRWGWSGLYSFVTVSRAAAARIRPSARFPTALLPDVQRALCDADLLIEEDARPSPPPWMCDTLVDDLAAQLPVPLRPYQELAVRQALNARQGVVSMATGGGKTVVFGALLKLAQLREPAMRAVVLFRNTSLVRQTATALEALQVRGVGSVFGGHVAEDASVLLATVQSAHNIPASLLKADILIADECHLFTARTSVDALRMFPAASMRLGFSATPWKERDEHHNMTLRAWLGPEICRVTTQELTAEHNVLSRAVCTFYDLSARNRDPFLWSAPYQEGYVGGVVENATLNQCVADTVCALDGRVLVLVNRLAHGDTLAQLIQRTDPSLPVHWVSGADSLDARQAVLEKLRASNSGRCVAILSSIGNTGIDVHVHHLVNAAGGLSPIATIQAIGRGLRTAHDKLELRYYDFINHANRYVEQHSHARVDTLRKEGHYVRVRHWKHT